MKIGGRPGAGGLNLGERGMPIVTLTTDFGLEDAYVGQVKGVILGLCPQAALVDLTHQIPPQQILLAAYVLAKSAPFFPPGAIHLAVVDPSVGTERRAIVAKVDGHFFVAPDNGILTLVLRDGKEAKVRQIVNQDLLRPTISPTFHGRDVFAPVAGHLAAGLEPARFGPRLGDPVLLEITSPVLQAGRIRGRVLHVDRFGNLITDIPAQMIVGAPKSNSPEILIGGQSLQGLHMTYAEVPPGEPLALFGSFDLVEIAVNQGRADDLFQARPGHEVEVVL